ncbi:DnaJ domain-containing protein [Chryseolinea sp. T2]|uniref:J domain-containing protein n=1 Tax=Chryseolinea sp. T2 TaxID=3129255 RepID=UPI003076DBE3
MDPYQILGVSRNDSSETIRAAYRKLVKKYHPDINSSPDAAQMTALINQAYDLITSNHWSLNHNQQTPTYSQQTATPEYATPEDPTEVYKRNYKARKFREAKAKKEARIRFEKSIYKLGWLSSFPSALFALIVILDFFLPPNVRYDMPIAGYEKIVRGTSTESFIRTASYYVEVPREMYQIYSLRAGEEPIFIEVTPILQSLKQVGIKHEEYSKAWNAPASPYAHFFFAMPYIILVISMIYIVKNEYSANRYPFCLLHLFIAFILLMKIVYS